VAAAAGFSPIYTTASPGNHATLRALGATACFDYRSPTVVSDIQAAVSASGKPLATIFDAVTTGTGFAEPPSDIKYDFTKSSPAIAKQCLSDGVKKEDTRLSATLVVMFDPDWKFCNSARPKEENVEAHDRILAVADWIFENNEGRFRIPKVRTVKGGEEGLKAIHDVFNGKFSMEKVVIEHPI
jgi:hypothetical protein